MVLDSVSEGFWSYGFRDIGTVLVFFVIFGLVSVLVFGSVRFSDFGIDISPF